MISLHVWIVLSIFEVAIAQPLYYYAGVVEFRPNMSAMDPTDILADHLSAYINIIRGDEANRTDIIVFPEGTLNNMLSPSFVPSPNDSIIPCMQKQDKFNDFLIKLSCTARDVRKYVVINLVEKENCSSVLNDPRPCANNGLNIYNTNVVFDRDGRIISRYRKVHIYLEAKNTTFEPEYGIFDTDFGVQFGHFICFDMLFYTPAQELVNRFYIKNIIFTSQFYSELPFLTASQLQQSWAWGNDVNVLAAGASYPELGSTGTGIYSGKYGKLVSTMTGGEGVRKLFVARVPILPNYMPLRKKLTKISDSNMPRRVQTGIKLLKDPQIEKYTSELLSRINGSHINRFLCYNSFCCNFTININFFENSLFHEHYKYRIGVFDGRRTYEKEEWSDIKVCALYACTSDDVSSCGQLFGPNINVESNLIFKSIEISGEFEKTDKILIMPNTLNDQLYSLDSDSIAWNVADEKTHFNANLILLTSNENLLTFGIYAQYFDKSAKGISTRANGVPTFWAAIISIGAWMFLSEKIFKTDILIILL